VIGERNPKEIGWLKEKYISKIQTIEKAKTYPTKTGILCKWCEFLSVCEDGKKWVSSHRKEPEAQETLPPTPPIPSMTGVPLVSKTLAPAVPREAVPVFSSLPLTVDGQAKSKKRRASLATVSPDQLPLF
jgi:hypothetical protein